MPFEPKLIRDDLSHLDDELALPDDLQELAGQLGEDAERLAACYPCLDDSNSSDSRSSSRDAARHVARQASWARWRGAAVAAAVMLACGMWAAGELARENGSQANTPEASAMEVADDDSVSTAKLSTIVTAMPIVPISGRLAGSINQLNNTNHLSLDNIGLSEPAAAWDAGDSFGGGTAAECADFFQNLSAPEQEALLDLFEDESQDYRDLPL